MSSTLNLAYTISAIDKLSPVLKKIDSQIKKLNASMQTLSKPMQLKLDTKKAQADVNKLVKATAPLNKSTKFKVDTKDATKSIDNLKKIKPPTVTPKADTRMAEASLDKLSKRVITINTVVRDIDGGTQRVVNRTSNGRSTETTTNRSVQDYRSSSSVGSSFVSSLRGMINPLTLGLTGLTAGITLLTNTMLENMATTKSAETASVGWAKSQGISSVLDPRVKTMQEEVYTRSKKSGANAVQSMQFISDYALANPTENLQQQLQALDVVSGVVVNAEVDFDTASKVYGKTKTNLKMSMEETKTYLARLDTVAEKMGVKTAAVFRQYEGITTMAALGGFTPEETARASAQGAKAGVDPETQSNSIKAVTAFTANLRLNDKNELDDLKTLGFTPAQWKKMSGGQRYDVVNKAAASTDAKMFQVGTNILGAYNDTGAQLHAQFEAAQTATKAGFDMTIAQLEAINKQTTELVASTTQNKEDRNDAEQASLGDAGWGRWMADKWGKLWQDLDKEGFDSKIKTWSSGGLAAKSGAWFGNTVTETFTPNTSNWSKFLDSLTTGFTSIENRKTAPIEQAKGVAGINPTPNTTNATVPSTTTATPIGGAADKMNTAADKGLQTAQMEQETAKIHRDNAIMTQQAVTGLNSAIERLASVPTPSVSYSFMPPLGNQGR